MNNRRDKKGFRNFFKNRNKDSKNKDRYKENYKERFENKTFFYKTSIKYEPNLKNEIKTDLSQIKEENILQTENNLDNNLKEEINGNIEIKYEENNFSVEDELKKSFEKDKYYNNEKVICSNCGKVIYDKSSSFTIKGEKEENFVCFDCAKNEIEKKYNISPRNKIVYLGAGTFGEIRQIKGEKGFIILRRFKYCSPKHEKFSNAYLPDNIEEIK